MTKKVLGVVVGYLIFALSAVIYFRSTGRQPDAVPTAAFAIITSIYGLVFSFIGGSVLQIIAKSGNLKLNYVLAIIIAGFALFSLLMTEGSHWTQIVSIALFAPCSIAGGYLCMRRRQS